MWERLIQYALLIRLDRPIGIFLLLWPTLWALWIASEGRPDPLIFFVFVLGVILMRSAGCAINDFADRELDPHVERTRNRPIASGKVSPLEALGVFAVLSLAALGLVVLMNRLTVYFAFAGIVLAATYPFMKRYHSLPQVHLGAAFGWSIPMAFVAQTGKLPTQEGWLLFIATILWATVYDTMYGMVDRNDDIEVGVKSTAILFGDYDRHLIGLVQTLMLVALLLVGVRQGLGIYYYLGLAAAAGFSLYQQYLIHDRLPENCLRAFKNNHYLGMVIFAGIVAHYLIIPSA